MSGNVPGFNPVIDMNNLRCPRIVSINHGKSVIAQGPGPTVLSRLPGMQDSEIAQNYASFLPSPAYARKYPSLVHFGRPPPPNPLRNPLLGINYSEVSHYHPNFLRPAASLYENLRAPKDRWLSTFTRPCSPVLPDFEFQPFHVPVRGDLPDDGIGNYLTDVNFDDPTKPYPVLYELSVKVPYRHRLIQRLVLSNPSAFHEKLQDAEYAHCFDQFGRLLDELAHNYEPNIQYQESFEEIKQCLLTSHQALSVGQLRRMADILVVIARMEWAVRRGLGYGLDDSLKYDERFMMDMWRRTRLARAAMADKEEEPESFIEPLEPLFGRDSDTEQV